MTGEELRLNDLSAFRPVGGNWKIAGAVAVDTSKERHLNAAPGQGILVCQPTDEHKDHLFTGFEHADLELEAEVMVPVKSNSGFYFQGRYEIQILDSWGVTEPRHMDIGGIYQRWDPSRGEGKEGYDGVAPPVNAAKKPGEWQRFKIKFRAPRFDTEGRKLENARFEEVWLNGILLHKDVEVSGPTRSPAFEVEAPRGPLMIQGDHGPLALRGIRYLHLE